MRLRSSRPRADRLTSSTNTVSTRAPAQIIKTFGKKKGEAFREEYAHRPSTGHTLVPESNERPAVKKLTAQDELTAIPQNRNPFE